MSDTTAVAVQQPQAESLVSILSRMSTNPDFNPDSFKILIEAAEREQLNTRRAEFTRALFAVQSKRLRVVKTKQNKNNKYAPLEDIDQLLAPHLAENNLVVSFDSPEPVVNGMMKMVCYIYHVNGYSEPRSIPMPVDDIGVSNQGKRMRPATQDHGSTVSYGRRQLLKMTFNVIEIDEDDDGQMGEGATPISQDQADTLRDKCKEYAFTGDDKRRVGIFAAKLQDEDAEGPISSFNLIRKCDYLAIMLLVEDMKP